MQHQTKPTREKRTNIYDCTSGKIISIKDSITSSNNKELQTKVELDEQVEPEPLMTWKQEPSRKIEDSETTKGSSNFQTKQKLQSSMQHVKAGIKKKRQPRMKFVAEGNDSGSPSSPLTPTKNEKKLKAEGDML